MRFPRFAVPYLSVAEALIAGGAYVTGDAAVHILDCQAAETALYIAQSIHPGEPFLCRVVLEDAKTAAITQLRTTLENVQTKGWGSGAGLEERIRRIENFNV